MSQLDATQLAKLQSLTRQVAEAPWVPFDSGIAWQLAQLAVSTGFSASDGAFMEQIQLNPLKTLLNWSLQVASLNSAVTMTPEEAYLADLTPGTYDTLSEAEIAEALAEEVYYGTDGRGFNTSEDLVNYVIQFDLDFSAAHLTGFGIRFNADPGAVTFYLSNGLDTSSTGMYPSENPTGQYFSGELVVLPGWWITSVQFPLAAKTAIERIYLGPSF